MAYIIWGTGRLLLTVSLAVTVSLISEIDLALQGTHIYFDTKYSRNKFYSYAGIRYSYSAISRGQQMHLRLWCCVSKHLCGMLS